MKLASELPLEIPAATINLGQITSHAGSNRNQPSFSSSLEAQQAQLKIPLEVEREPSPVDEHLVPGSQILPELGNLLPLLEGELPIKVDAAADSMAADSVTVDSVPAENLAENR